MAKAKASATTHETKPKQGKSGKKGTTYSPASMPLASASPRDQVQTLNRPRPATTRYPISKEAFDKLERAAVKAKVPAKKKTTIHRDKGASRRELAAQTGVAPREVEPHEVAEPAAAPTPLGNFAGFTDTGW